MQVMWERGTGIAGLRSVLLRALESTLASVSGSFKSRYDVTVSLTNISYVDNLNTYNIVSDGCLEAMESITVRPNLA